MTAIALAARLLAAGLAMAVVVTAAPANAIDVQRVRVDDIEAWLVEDHSQPIIAVSVAFRGGAALDPDRTLGLATMTMALLDEGAGEMDAAVYQSRVEDIAAEIGFGADLDTLSARLRTLSDHRDAAFDLLAEALARPRFDADAIERVRGQMQVTLKRQATDPGAVATRRFFAAMFPNHPYGRPVEGTPETVAAIDRADIVAFASARLARSALVIGVSGDISAEQLGPLLRRTFGGLPAVATAAAIPDATPTAAGAIDVADVAAPQSAIIFGQRGLLRSDPRFYALTVVNQALGGSGLNARLFEEVREKRGLAYSVYTNLMPFQHAALWLGRAGTGNERVAETLAVIRGEWQRLKVQGLASGELDDAKTYLTGSFPLRLTSNAQVAGTLVSMQVQGLGIDWLDRRNDLINAVTLDDANRLAATLLDPPALRFVIAGQPTGLSP